MSNQNGSRPTVTDCTFRGNFALFSGGGLSSESGSSPIVTHCSFVENACGTQGGGGIKIDNSSSATLANCAFIGNESRNGPGGGLNRLGLPMAVTSCTFSGNSASNGGGIFNGTTGLAVTNCTFSGNIANTGRAIRDKAGAAATNCVFWTDNESSVPVTGFVTVAYSSIQDADPNDGDIPFGGEANGNIDDNPLFADADGDDDIIGTADDDLRLPAGLSPCIDAGNNAAVPAGVTTDLDGNGRILDDGAMFDTGNGTRPIVDMGAYEVPGDCNNNDTPDALDPDADGDGVINECDPDADNDGLLNDDELDLGSDPLYPDTDKDGVSDGPSDPDGPEGVIHAGPDNCPLIANHSQTDTDNDDVGDRCDPCPDDDQDICAASPGDMDNDGDVDLTDYDAFLDCFTGPGGAVSPGCEPADTDKDQDSDLIDFGVFQDLFTGGP